MLIHTTGIILGSYLFVAFFVLGSADGLGLRLLRRIIEQQTQFKRLAKQLSLNG